MADVEGTVYEYLPAVDDLELSLLGIVADRLLLLGGEPTLGLPAASVRHADAARTGHSERALHLSGQRTHGGPLVRAGPSAC